MKTVNTKRGPRVVQAIPANESIWAVYHGERPEWLTVAKGQNGKWWASVWGANEQEVKKRLRELGRRERSSAGTRGRDRSGRCPHCGQDEWDGLFCDFCGEDGC